MQFNTPMYHKQNIEKYFYGFELISFTPLLFVKCCFVVLMFLRAFIVR